jgi:hypothetical protein
VQSEQLAQRANLHLVLGGSFETASTAAAAATGNGADAVAGTQ